MLRVSRRIVEPDMNRLEPALADIGGHAFRARKGPINAPTDDIVDGFARRHRSTCQRCKDYGAANTEIED